MSKGLKIGIEAQPLVGNKTGVGFYLENLLRAVQDKKNDNNKYSLILFNFFLRRHHKRPLEIASNKISYLDIWFLPARVFNKLLSFNMLPPLDIIFGRKVYFFANYIHWPILFSPSALVVYDLVVYDMPQYMSHANRAHLERHLPRSIKRAKHIITISKFSKQRIVEEFNLKPSDISIVYPAVDPETYFPRKLKEIFAVRKKYGLPKKYLLYHGTLEPRKNILGLLKSYESLSLGQKDTIPLVLSGGMGWHSAELRKELSRLKKAGLKITTTGYVDEGDLPAILSAAELFLYPSFYEGFGIPPLEAMACGTPVICSNKCSLPEVVGEAGILLDPKDHEKWAATIRSTLGSPEEMKRLSERGINQASRFSWRKSADKLLGIFSSLDSLHKGK